MAEHATTGHTPGQTRTEIAHAALVPVLKVTPDFLAGRLHADAMTDTMIAAARTYREEGLRLPGDGADAERVEAVTPKEQDLDAVMKELYVCGTGYQAGRCEADCVERTMSHVMAQFGHLVPHA